MNSSTNVTVAAPSTDRDRTTGRRRNPFVPYLLLLALTLAAAALRLFRLGKWSFYHEEVYMLQALQNPSNYRLTWPRISLALIDVSTQTLGISEWSARLGPALIGILTVPTLFFLFRKVFGSEVAWISTLLLAVSPWHLIWSQSARFYTSVMLFCTLALVAFFWAIERDRPAYILLFYLLLFVATVERDFALLIVPAAFVYLFLVWILPFEKPPGLRARNLLLLALPGLVLVTRNAYRFVRGEWFMLSETLDVFAGQVSSNPLRLSGAVAYQLGIPLVCIGLGGGIYFLANKSRKGLFILSAAIVPLVSLVALSLFVPTRNLYAFLILPFWIVLAAMAVKEMSTACSREHKLLVWSVLAVLVVSALSQNFLYYSYEHGDRSNWRAAFQIVQKEKYIADVVWSTYPELGKYYLNHDTQSVESLENNALAGSAVRNWFVIDEATRQNQASAYEWIRKHCSLYDTVPGHSTARNLALDIYLCDQEK